MGKGWFSGGHADRVRTLTVRETFPNEMTILVVVLGIGCDSITACNSGTTSGLVPTLPTDAARGMAAIAKGVLPQTILSFNGSLNIPCLAPARRMGVCVWVKATH